MELLSALGINSNNSGASTGSHWWSQHKRSGEIHSYNPTNGEVIASIYCAGQDDYEQVVKEAERAFLVWRQIPAPKRGEVIRAIGDELRKQKNLLGSLVSLEMGKSKQEGDGEVQEMIDMADFAVGQSRMLYGNTMHSERAQHRMYEQWHPLGIVLAITAFNFPVAVWSWNAFIAAICGNSVIWKPSPKTPLCAIAVQHIGNRVLNLFGYRGIFSLLITDDNKMVKQMVHDERIPLVSFTGSTEVDRKINTIVAQRLGKALLELSGNNAIIVDEHADLKLAVPAIVFGATGTAGQRCTTTRRLIIHETIYNNLIKVLVAAYKKISIGDPLDQKNLMGPFIDQYAVDQFVHTVQEAKQQGGKILFGGNTIKRKGFFVEPTIIEAENHLEVVQKEAFAPILYVMKYKKIEDAIAMQNHTHFGLSSSLLDRKST